MLSDFDTGRFIIEVQSRPVLWNQESSEYSNKGNKHQKFKAWDDVASAMYPSYHLKEAKERAYIHSSLTRKWKSLRDCFTRELNFQSNKRSGTEKINKKQYVYFNQLSFLKPSIENRKLSLGVDDTLTTDNSNRSEHFTWDGQGAFEDVQFNKEEVVMKIKEVISQQVKQQPATESVKPDMCNASLTSRKRIRENIAETEINIMQDTSKILHSNTVSEQPRPLDVEDDSDKFFLLSLLPDIKKVHEDDRLEMKGEMISLISKWIRLRQNQPTQNKMQECHETRYSNTSSKAILSTYLQRPAKLHYVNNSFVQNSS